MDYGDAAGVISAGINRKAGGEGATEQSDLAEAGTSQSSDRRKERQLRLQTSRKRWGCSS